jgi:hypothetical protein
MKKTTFQEVTTGKVISLLSRDVYQFDEVFSKMYYLWMSPVKIIFCGFYLNYVFGCTAVVGICIIVVYFLSLCKILLSFLLQILWKCVFSVFD